MTTNQTTLAYLAGILDGEGSISIGKANLDRRPKHGVRYFHLEVHITMQNRPVLELFAQHFGGNIRPSSSSVCWRICWSSRKAAAVLRALSPYLLIKREQAKTALAFQEGLFMPGAKGHTSEHYARCAAFRDEVMRLNNHDRQSIRIALKQRTLSSN